MRPRTLQRMGIRYYGWAITDDEAAEAETEPWPVIRRADRRGDEPGWTNTCFDKAWPLLQRLFTPEGVRQPRPGYELVAGDVTYPYGYLEGYEPYVGVIARDRVPAIARDVASVSRSDVRLFCSGLRYGDQQLRRDDEGYLAYHLAKAQTFTADAAARGHAILYLIR